MSEWVLVVEDDARVLQEVREVVEGEMFHMVGAGNWLEARKALIRSKAPCLVLVDALIPGADEFALEIARKHTVATIPIRLQRCDGEIKKKAVRLDILVEALREHCGDPLSAVNNG